MPITFFPIINSSSDSSTTTSTAWGNITGTLANQSDLQNALDDKSNIEHNHDEDYAPINHIVNVSNPHSVTKSQVGLDNLTNDAQLKRSSGDFNTFTEKATPVANDVILIEDSADSYAKKKISLSKISSSGGNGKVLVSSDDTTSDYLYNKIIVTSGIKKTEDNSSANEALSLSLDIHNQSRVSSVSGDAELLLYASADNPVKKATINDLFLKIWVNIAASYLNSNTLSFSGTEAQSKMLLGSLFTCTNSGGTTRKVGYVKLSSYSDGTIYLTVQMLTQLDSDDKDFCVAPQRKFWDYVHIFSIPGEITADTSNSQGVWLLDVPFDSWLLSVDCKVRTAATGATAACAMNLYQGTTAMFSEAIDLGSLNVVRNRVPTYGSTPGSLTQYDDLSMRITNSAGTTKAADLQVKAYIIPKNLFEAYQ